MIEVEPVTPSVAKSCVREWHYSRSYPAGVSERYGVWEDGRFIGAVIFGTGNNHRIGSPYGLQQEQTRELVRVALDDHQVTVSHILSRTIRMFRVQFPDVRLLVSYADPVHGHHGGIYQASNWTYTGRQTAHSITAIRINGELLHERTAASRYGTNRMALLREIDPEAHRVKLPRKHVYALGLDRKMRRMLSAKSEPHPKKEA